jgi:hypothetical protein
MWGFRSRGVPRESLDPPEDLPKQALRQVAFGQRLSASLNSGALHASEEPPRAAFHAGVERLSSGPFAFQIENAD